MANLTTVTMSDAIKTMYERRLQTRALPRLPHGRWGVVARLNNFGAYELRKYGSLSAITSALTEGTTPPEQASPSLTLTTITPLYYGAWIGQSDELEMEAFDPIISEVSGILGEQAGLSADTLIRNTITAGATKLYSNGKAARTDIAAGADVITYADFVKAMATLQANNALPLEGEDIVCIMHPYTWASLMQDPTFVNLFSEEAPNSPLRSGLVGRILQTQIYVSSNSRSYSGGGATASDDVYSMLFIGRESYGYVGMAGLVPSVVDNAGPGYSNMTGQKVKPVEIIVKQLGSAGSADALNQRSTIGWKMSLASSILNSAWIIDLEHANAFS